MHVFASPPLRISAHSRVFLRDHQSLPSAKTRPSLTSFYRRHAGTCSLSPCAGNSDNAELTRHTAANRLDVADPCARRNTYPDLALATRHAGGGDVLPGCLLRLLGVGRHGGETLPCRRSVFQRWGGAASRAARSAAQTVSPGIQVILSRQQSP